MSAPQDPIATAPLQCGLCRRESDESAKGWHGYLGREDDDSITVVILRRECAERELDAA